MSSSTFTAVRSVGGLLPNDTLSAIAAGRGVDGLTGADYHLLPGEALRGEANRAWQRLLGAWRVFRDSLTNQPQTDVATGLTRERWLLPLFQELGYGRLETAPAGGVIADDKAFPVSHLWRSNPIHLLGAGVDLDRRTGRVAGAAKAAPHSMVQELLNRSDDYLWAFLSNGRTLRVLRDNASLVRQAYLEFDLEAIFDGELFNEFVLLYLVCHQSRVENRDETGPSSCWLESWRSASLAAGTRALEHLRDGVVQALRAFGAGFLRHPANRELRDALRTGGLTPQDYYRELLRLAYRLLFLFVAEDRDLLHHPDATLQARDRYARYYSTSRLRQLARRRRAADRHPDHWQSVQVVVEALGRPEGLPDLGLPYLGGFLFDDALRGPLAGAQLANRDLLAALRPLALVRDDGGLSRAVDYRNLDSEELGSVYESLLQLVPQIDPATVEFRLEEIAGNERKTTGSYYTPSSLISSLLDTALDPLLDRAVKDAADHIAAERALLDLTVCDPACGSGHFLVAAARRVAKRLAETRTGDPEPAPSAMRTALRDVIGRCIYGVDLNDLAAELAKVSLWLEALEPGKPLSFLDANIKVGNALLGATPALLESGIPDEAFVQLVGDDKKHTADLKKRNKRERENANQGELFTASDLHLAQAAITAARAAVDRYDDTTPAGVAARSDAWRRLEAMPELQHARFIADAWCSAFVWPKTPDGAPAITDAEFRKIVASGSPDDIPLAQRKQILELAREYRFFHWHLEFPDVFSGTEREVSREHGWLGGFSLVLGNPPWDTLSPDTREYFAALVPGIRGLSKAEKDTAIAELLAEQHYAALWDQHQRRLFATVHLLKNSGRYTMYAPGNLGKGDFNVYRSFAELALTFTRRGGYAMQVVPSGIFAGANASAIRNYMLDRCTWLIVYGFNNKGGTWFPGVTLENFAAYAVHLADPPLEGHSIVAAFGMHRPEALATDLASSRLTLAVEDIRHQNPETLAIPDVRDADAARLSQRLYRTFEAFGKQVPSKPYRDFSREIDMSDRDGVFREDGPGLPVYEGRMIDFYDHRAKRYVGGHGNSSLWRETPFGDPEKAIVPQWYVPAAGITNDSLLARTRDFRVGFMDVADPGRQRSFVSAVVPPGTICGDKVPTLKFDVPWYLPIYLAVANSLVVDFLARQRVLSKKLALNILDSLPIARLDQHDPRSLWLAERALRLTCTSPEMTPLWNAMAAEGWVERCSDHAVPGEVVSDARRLLRAQIDAYVARHVYGLTRDELQLVFASFPQLESIEQKAHGEYLTRRLVLAAYDVLADAPVDLTGSVGTAPVAVVASAPPGSA